MRKRIIAVLLALGAAFGTVVAVSPVASPASAAAFSPWQMFMSHPRWICFGHGQAIRTNGVGAYGLWNRGYDCYAI